MDRPEQASEAGFVQYLNPEGMFSNPAFTQVVVATGPVKTVYIGMQNAVSADRQIVGKGDIAAQTAQTLENVERCLAAAGATPEHLVSWTIYVVQGQPIEPGFAVFQRWWGDRPNPPANSVLFVVSLGHPDRLLGIEAIAVVPLPA